MGPGIAKAVVLVASAVMVAIRAPHGKRSRRQCSPLRITRFTSLRVFAFRIRAEEQLMVDAFGDEYVAYKAKTKRLVPDGPLELIK